MSYAKLGMAAFGAAAAYGMSRGRGRRAKSTLAFREDPDVAELRKILRRLWKDRAAEQGRAEPADLTDACKFGALLAQDRFGGRIEGNWHHVWLRLDDGRIIDLSGPEDAEVQRLGKVAYRLDRRFLRNRDFKESLESCQLRVRRYSGGAAPGLARGRRSRNVTREQWMGKFVELKGDPPDDDEVYWDTAAYLYSKGLSPQEAAKQRLGWTTAPGGKGVFRMRSDWRNVGRRAGRVRVYKSLKNLSKKAGRPISLEQITSGRINLPDVGWTSFRYSLTDEDAAAIAEALGGWDRTQQTVARVLRYGGAGRLDSWMRDRIQYNPREGWHYIAGQDYPWETNKIRRALS